MAREMLRYCYAVTRGLETSMRAAPSGVYGAPVLAVEESSLVALVSEVPAVEFDESALRAGLEDLAWLEKIARTHNAVVDWAARHSATLPFRLATIYRDDDRVRAVLRGGRDGFGPALDRVAGRVEWGVKVYTESGRTTARGTAASGSERSGRSYLRRRMTELQSGEDAWQLAVDTAQRVDAELAVFAEGRRLHRAQNAELSGARGHNVLNVAYLLADATVPEFLAEVERMRDSTQGCRIELSGPWVPYSFVPDDLSTLAKDDEQGARE